MSDTINLGKAKIDIEATNLANLTSSVGKALTDAIKQSVEAAKIAIQQKLPTAFSAYNTAIQNIVERQGLPSTVSDYGAEAAADVEKHYSAGYEPSKIQTFINQELQSRIRQYDENGFLDKDYLNETKSATKVIAALRTQSEYAAQAGTRVNQLEAVLAAIANESDLAKKRSMANRAIGLLRGLGSNQMVDVGLVSSEDSAASLALAEKLKGIVKAKTPGEVAIEEEKADERARRLAVATVLKRKNAEIAANNALLRSSASATATIERQKDAAWDAHYASKSATDKLYYQQTKRELSQKEADMERGFRAMEAARGVTDNYDVDKDSSVIAHNIDASLNSATMYLNRASAAPAGSQARKDNIAKAKQSLTGATPAKIERAGGDVEANTVALNNLNDRIATLTKEVEPISKAFPYGGAIRLGTGLVKGMDSYLSGTYSILADQINPYNTRRDVYQNWAISGGTSAMGIGGGLAALGYGPAGLLIAALGGLTSVIGSYLKGEKKAGQSAQQEAKTFLFNKYAYGMSGSDFAYARAAGQSGFASMENFTQMKQTSAMLPGALAFGAVSEEQMMAYSLMPNYYQAQLNGASSMELANAFKTDMDNLPASYRPYIASIVPGGGMNMLAYTQSDSFGYYNKYGNLYNMHGMLFEAKAPRLSMTADANVMQGRFDATAIWDRKVDTYGVGNSDPVHPSFGFLSWWEAITEGSKKMVPYLVGEGAQKLGDIIVNIDGTEVSRKSYSFDDFLKDNIYYNTTGA